MYFITVHFQILKVIFQVVYVFKLTLYWYLNIFINWESTITYLPIPIPTEREKKYLKNINVAFPQGLRNHYHRSMGEKEELGKMR